MEPTDRSLSPGRIGSVLALSSFAIVAFLLCIFRLLSFFIMPSLFFDLLFIGFPLGAVIGVRFWKPTVRDFYRSLVLLHLVMLGSLVLCLFCKHVDYLRATFYDLNVTRLLIQIGTFSAMFLPFFAAYGLSEYLGYQVGREHLRGRMRVVYAAYLFGAAMAYLAVHWGVGVFGVARMMVAAVALLLASAAIIARPKIWLILETALLVALAAWPGLEGNFLQLYKGIYSGKSITSTKGIAASGEGWKPIHQAWGRYSLCELMESKTRQTIAAFYNDVFQWSFTRPDGVPSGAPTLDRLPFYAMPGPNSRVLVIGSGGGRQIQYARRHHSCRELVAVELEPEVFRMTRVDHPDAFDRVYEAANATPVCADGRTYLAEHDEPFDLIFMPSVGGYPQMMLEPGNMIRTLEAYELMVERLTPEGVLAVWYPRGLDPQGILTTQYMETFWQMGLAATGYGDRRDDEVLILASRSEARTQLPLDELQKSYGPGGILPFRPDAEPHFTPITDLKPFLGGNVRHIMSLETIHWLFGTLAFTLVVAAAALAGAIRKTGDPRISGISFPAVVIVSLLVGANFLIMEHAAVIALFQKTFVFYDALLMGAIGFLILTGLGSIVIGAKARPLFWLLFVGCCLGLIIIGDRAKPMNILALIIPASFSLGSFFPYLFDSASTKPLAIFAFDAIGAAIGAVASFFIPIAAGLDKLYLLAGCVGIATAAAMTFFAWRSQAPLEDANLSAKL